MPTKKPAKKTVSHKLKKKIQAIPDRKRYIDFIAALFALPVMVTVLIINIGNLQNKNEPTSPTPPNTIIIETTPPPGNLTTPQEGCKRMVGPIEITSPREGQTINSSPVNILITYDDSEYCSVVWSYRLNNGPWSEFTSNSISIYNPPQGEVDFDLRVQSTVSNDQTELQRKFEYTGANNNPPASPSASF